ncbi:MAG: DNA methyltransferase [Bryobacterales bacterium]|nr:DNA methyltransferase [Bryobacterales bacterium]
MAEPNWKNRTLWTGDNLPLMRGLNSESVDLIYLDPPFNSKKTYSAPIGSLAAEASFKDFWTFDDVDRLWVELLRETDRPLYHVIETARLVHGNGMAAYLGMMAQRLQEMKRLLKPTGSIYLHCDPTASHYLKVLMDLVFGKAQFRNEIAWQRTSAHNDPKRFGRIGDRILFYSKSSLKTFHPIMAALSDEQRARYKYQDENGLYKAEQLTAPHYSPTRTIDWRGVHPGANRQWRFGTDELERLYAGGRILCRKDGRPRKDGLKEYLHESMGAPAQDIWTDILRVANTSKERTHYPTQKPLALLERIIKASSNPGDVVLDPFCGCATTCVSAEKLGCEWIGIDIGEKAIDLVESRLQDAIDELEMFHPGDVIHRTDLGKLPRYTVHKDALYGKQGGDCYGCGEHFLKLNLTVDHIVPLSKGGTDHVENLWLLCQACNSSKGNRSQVEFLKTRMSKRRPVLEWLVAPKRGERLFRAQG